MARGSKTVRLRRRRLRLFRDNPYCTFCGGVMVLAKDRPNSVTIEHLVSRNHPLRGKITGKTVLACKRCNGQRGQAELEALPVEELWRRAGHLERMIAEREGVGDRETG